jgi:NADH-quinone oxidoreductase subunit L
VGCFTALLAALIALTQNDLKRVLAYSTVSQLGFMFLGLGTATAMGISGAMFHLVTHAFFKALLFLGAGSVMHAMGGVIDMTKFGGLRKVMPQTHLTFAIGALALAGLAPLSGFWSKDTILSATRAASLPQAAQHAEAHDGEHGTDHHIVGGPSKMSEKRKAQPVFGMPQPTLYKILFWTATFTAFLTAFYTTRAYLMTFWGPERIPHEAGHHAHESPPIMTVPLWILSIGAAFLGMALGHTTGVFDRFLGETIPGAAVHHATDWTVVSLSIAVSVAGIALGFLMYGRPSSLPETVAKAFGPLTEASRNKFYLDEVFGGLFVLPLQALAHLSRFVDWLLIDTVFIGGLAKIPSSLLGRPARPMQNGLVQFYALSMMLALAVLMWALLLKQ